MSEETSPNNNYPDKEKWERTLNLFKLEYEQAAQRYENLYKAIWQIFSYMAVLSGAVLVFASKSDFFSIQAIKLIALTPFLFWFLAIYIPMDQYGQDIRKRLSCMEIKMDEKFSTYWQLYHYQTFGKKTGSSPVLWPPYEWWWRARLIIIIFGIFVSVFWCIFLIVFIGGLGSANNSPDTTINQTQPPVEVTLPKTQIEELKNTLDTLSKKIDSIDLLVQEIKADTDTMQQPTK